MRYSIKGIKIISYFVFMLFIACYKGDIDLSADGSAKLTGFVYNTTNNPLDKVKIEVYVKGANYEVVTNDDGYFSLEILSVIRGEGYNVVLSKDNYTSKNMSAVFMLANLRLHFDKIEMLVKGNEHVQERVIRGKLLDNFSYSSLAGATVQTTNINGDLLVATTGLDGVFEFTNSLFAIDDTYTLLIQKENYIRRSDISVQITSIINELPEAIRLFRQFGELKGSIVEYQYDSLGNKKLMDDYTITILDEERPIITKTYTYTTDDTTTGDFSVLNTDTQEIYLGKEYIFRVESADYKTLNHPFTIDTVNEYDVGTLYLYRDLTLHGKVKVSSSDVGLDRVIVYLTSLTPNLNYTTSIVTDSSGEFSFPNDQNIIVIGREFQLRVAHPGYQVNTTDITIDDTNANADIEIKLSPTTGMHKLKGIIKNHYNNDFVQSANISLTTPSSVYGTTSNGNGEFVLEGAFEKRLNYNLEISHPDYTGENTKTHTLSIVYADNDTSDGDPDKWIYSLESTQLLHPLGIFYEELNLSVTKDIKQTLEDFLTGNAGLTITARKKALVPSDSNSIMNNTSEDIEAQASFYLHIDFSNAQQPITAQGVYANTTLPLNPIGQQYIKKGYYGEDLRHDTRTLAWNVDRKSYFKFYIPQFLNSAYLNIHNATSNPVKIYSRFTEIANQILTTNNSILVLDAIQKGWYIVSVSHTNDSQFGFFDMSLHTNASITVPILDVNRVYTTNDIILSGLFVDRESGSNRLRPSLYIAGKGEVYNGQTSSGSIYLEKIGPVGSIIRGRFYGNLIHIPSINNTADAVKQIKNDDNLNGDGYFNIIRQE